MQTLTLMQTHSNPVTKFDLSLLMVGLRGQGSPVRVPFRTLAHSGLLNSGLQRRGGVTCLSTSSWSQVLNTPQKGTWLPLHTLNLGCGGCAGKKGVGLVPCSGAVATSLGIFHPGLARAREERVRFVSCRASGTFPQKLPAPRLKPPLPHPLSWPRPPLSPWRKPASAVTAALSSRGCRGGGESLTP